MNKTAIIIGATGLIGRALVDELVRQKDIASVVTLTRRPLNIQHEKFENHVIDFSKLEDAKAYFNSSDLFFSCLGTTKKQAGTIAQQRIVDLDYQCLAAKIAKQAGIKRYYLVSSSAASSSSLSPYLKMKGELEDNVLGLGFERCVIFRPSLLLGQREQQRAGELWAGKVMPLLAHVPYFKRYRPIQGVEVAAKMARVAMSDIHQEIPLQNTEFYNLDEIF